MQISAETKQFLIEHKIDITEAEFEAHHKKIHNPFKKITDNHEYIIYTYMENRVKREELEQFLLLRNTAESMYMMGNIYIYDNPINLAIAYYKQSYKMGYVGACYNIADCYDSLDDDAQYLKYISLGAAKYCDPISCRRLGLSYQHGYSGLKIDLRKARRYISLSINAGYRVQYGSDDLDEIELELLKEFETKLNKDDYVLAYELKVKHGRQGLKDLQKMIEKEYYNVLGQTLSPWGLLKDLSNIVVSYLL